MVWQSADTSFCKGIVCPKDGRKKNIFRISEAGFGTGLNFLATWQLWRETRTQDSWLYFESIEGFPLDREQLKLIHQEWKELKALSKMLLAAKHSSSKLLPDWQEWPEERIKLRLHHVEVLPALRVMQSNQVDAWFLDGFSPKKNPEMWTRDVLREVARITCPEGTCATYTAASHVRKGLEDSGFVMKKIKGFAQKREMLHGCKL
jgi:tRNA 5-methylaminomethyl-2-thiouridine biosynthesis bifunctional protein